MRTVKWLRAELAKFPDDAECYAYEGEVTGVVVNSPDPLFRNKGIIYCSESGYSQGDTELLEKVSIKESAGLDSQNL